MKKKTPVKQSIWRKIFSWQYALMYVPVLIFAAWLSTQDLKTIGGILHDSNIWLVLLGAAMAYPMILTRAWRWQYLLGMQGIHLPLNVAFRAYIVSIFLGSVTPGRLGDFVKLFYLTKEKGITFGKGMSSVLLDRFFDLGVLMLLGGLGVELYSMSKEMLWVVMASIIVLGVLAAFLLSRRLSGPFLKFVFKLFFKSKPGHAMEQYHDFYNGVQKCKSFKLIIPFLISVFSYCFFFGGCYFLALAVHINISLSYLVLCVTITNFISVIPISVSGMGTADAALIGLFYRVGIPSQQAISLRILFFAIFGIFLCAWGAWVYYRHPLNLKKSQEQM